MNALIFVTIHPIAWLLNTELTMVEQTLMTKRNHVLHKAITTPKDVMATTTTMTFTIGFTLINKITHWIDSTQN